MITKTFYFTESAEVISAISKLIMSIPCFIDTKRADKNRFYFYITCRVEDEAVVDRRLAPYI